MKTKLLKKVRKRFEILDRPKGGHIFDHFHKRPHLLIYDKHKSQSMFAYYDVIVYGGEKIREIDNCISSCFWAETREEAIKKAKPLLLSQILNTYDKQRTRHKNAMKDQRKVWYVD